jgi:hypothetical protein
MASEVTIEAARKLVELVIGPEEIVAKAPEFKFADVNALLKQNRLAKLPPLPSKEQCGRAKEQKKALIFRVGLDGAGQPVTLISLKERFGALIYSSWYVKPPAPFAVEPIAAGWALVDLDPLPGSADKTYDEQIAFAKEQGVQFKSPAADAYDLLVTYKVTGKFFRDEPANGRTGALFNNEPVKISHFDRTGMCISTGWGKTVKHADVGAATELML